MSKNPIDILSAIAQVISDKKGMNILALDVRGLSNISDYLLIAEGNVEIHVRALARAVEEEMRKQGGSPVRTEGEKNGDWAVLDDGSVVVHLFSPGMRERYCLESLWKGSKILDLVFS
jgi:ribosome-associated protein